MRNEARLTDKVAVVTGGARGIGRAAALLLARAGAAVVVTARTESEIGETADQIRQEGGRALAFAADVSDWSAMEGLARATQRTFAPADVVVINASVIDPVGDTWKVDPAKWAQNVDIGLTGAFYTVRAFLPGMVSRCRGVLIFVSSGAATHTVPGWSAYCASKAGLDHFSRNLTAEIDQLNYSIRVHTLYPGIVDTAMQEQIRQMPEDKFPLVKQYRRYYERDQLRPPEEPGRLIWWLATPMAADFHGQIISLDDPGIQERVSTDLDVPTFTQRE